MRMGGSQDLKNLLLVRVCDKLRKKSLLKGRLKGKPRKDC